MSQGLSVREKYIHGLSKSIELLIETLYHKLEKFSCYTLEDLQLFIIHNDEIYFNTFGNEIAKDFQYILDILKEEHDIVLYD